jgi:hypothetical protein
MSQGMPFVADGPDRLRRAIAALPATERDESARRLDLDPSEVAHVPVFLLGRWRRPEALAWWLRLAGTGSAAPVDRRCYLGRSLPVAPQAGDNPTERS